MQMVKMTTSGLLHKRIPCLVTLIILIYVGWLKLSPIISPKVHNVDVPQESVSFTTTSSPKRMPIKKRLVVTRSNGKLVNFTQNLLRSIEKVSTTAVEVVAEDKASVKAIHAHINSTQQWGIRKPKVTSQPALLLEYLELGFEIFYVDSDAYWFRDPFPYFEGQFDFALTKDFPQEWNAGLGYYKRTNRTLQFLNRWKELLGTTKGGNQEREVLNKLLTSMYIPDLKLRLLNSENFPNAGYFFPMYPTLERCREDTDNTVVFFASQISDLADKTAALKKCKMWII